MPDADARTLRTTPLREEHLAAGGQLVPFAGWEMPRDYGSILEETRSVRTTAGLFDVSHMGRFFLEGPQLLEELDQALGAAMTDLPAGKARYSLLLDDQGGILDDLIVYRTGEEQALLVVNAANRERDRGILEQRLKNTVLEDRTLDGGGILALQGPDSRSILAEATGRSGLCPSFLDLGRAEAAGQEVLVARTGYTGEYGYEFFCPPGALVPLWRRLLELGARPAGLGARDVLRLEAALPLYGHEIHEGVHPFEAGLRFGVRGWKTRHFPGAEALRRNPAPPRRLAGLTTSEKRVPRQGYTVLAGEGDAARPVGEICSGAWSPTLERPIATALIEKEAEAPFQVEARGRRFPVEEVPLPFVPHRSRD